MFENYALDTLQNARVMIEKTILAIDKGEWPPKHSPLNPEEERTRQVYHLKDVERAIEILEEF